MLQESPSSLNANHVVKMLAVLEQLEGTNRTNNTGKYFMLLIFKSGLDMAVLYFCSQKRYTNFLSMCNLSIGLADLLITFLMGTVWFLGAERSLVSPCFLLANASAVYGALPVPMMCLGLLDYCFYETCPNNHTAFRKPLMNGVLLSLVWMYAVIFSFGSVSSEQSEMDYVIGKALVCAVEESTLITVFLFGLFAVTLFAMLPFWSRIPRWMREADKIHEAREAQENKRSDLFFAPTWTTETKSSEESDLEENIRSRPPLWFSLTLAFLLFWMPYLSVSVACLVFGLAVPAYISVNLLWLECANSFLQGVLFWVQSKKRGPYSHLPENVCQWQIYWHLSKGTQQPQLPAGVFNSPKERRSSLLHV